MRWRAEAQVKTLRDGCEGALKKWPHPRAGHARTTATALAALILLLTATFLPSSPAGAQGTGALSPAVDADSDGRITFSELQVASQDVYAGLIAVTDFIVAVNLYQRFQPTTNRAVTSGEEQVVNPADTLPEPFVVTLEDQFGNPLAGEPVSAEIVAGEGDLSVEEGGAQKAGRQQRQAEVRRITTLTDQNGRAAFRLQVGFGPEDVVVVVTGAQVVTAFVAVVGQRDRIDDPLPPGEPALPFLIVDTLEDQADPPFDSDQGLTPATTDDLPGADGFVSLREAIVAANHSQEVRGILFNPELAGGVIAISFDDGDADLEPDDLPGIRRNNLFVFGDPSLEGIPGISLDGGGGREVGLRVEADAISVRNLAFLGFRHAAVLVRPPADSLLQQIEVTDNAILLPSDGEGLGAGIIVAGDAADVEVLRNSMFGDGTADQVSILVTASDDRLAAPARGAVAGVRIQLNRLEAPLLVVGGRGGIGATITDLTIQGNTITAERGIVIQPTVGTAGSNVTIDGVRIFENELIGPGPSLPAGEARAGEGIGLSACCGPGMRLEVTMGGNLITEFPGMGVAIYGSEDENFLEAALQENEITNNGGYGVLIGGVPGPASEMLIDLGGGPLSHGGNLLAGNRLADLSVQIPLMVTAMGNRWDHEEIADILSFDIETVEGAEVSVETEPQLAPEPEAQ